MPDDFYDSFIRFGINLGSESTTARDMLSIVDAYAVTEDGRRASKPRNLLNFYGISYGTFLGQTFASMFPERVGNMVLDGVVDPESYLASLTYNNLNHLDGVIAGFFIHCHQAGPSECSYYTGSSARDIYERFHQSYARLDAEKAKEENWANATDVESALLLLKVGLLAAAYEPAMQFGMLSDVLVGLESAISHHKLSTWNKDTLAIYGDPSVDGFDNAPFALGVLCSDQGNKWYNKTLEDFRPLLAELESQSIVGDVWIKTLLGCSGWSIKATEIFTGPFTGNTATPILFVGNTYDPVTPFDK
ncbi:putative alpha beta hydrolase fold family [Diaporthe ampelina]|uniref:Putative alpha beta hydrolase fold family n=1 Tax=Diaporthe ampelina TaxID=1214573 RepID=A0A0G2FCM9_9PEZI|nr:putative alpha beta hydrolase fold family [Diaporthe ampelina]